MQFLVAPLEALTDSRLSDPERRVLLALYSFYNKETKLAFPSITVLAERANIKDKTRVSKITTSLAEKGWLTKKKKGFTGCNVYKLCLPECLSNLDSDANLVLDANLDSDASSNLDSDAKCEVGTRDQLQVTDHITDHINNTPHKPPKGKKPCKKKVLAKDFELPSCVTETELQEFIDHRDLIKKPMSELAVNKFLKHLVNLSNRGFYVRELIDTAIMNGWQSVHAPKGGNHEAHRQTSHSAVERVRAANARRESERQRQTERPIN